VAKYYGGFDVDRFGNVIIATQESFQLVATKFNPQGVMLWTKVFSGGLNPKDLAVDSYGNIFVVGGTNAGRRFLYKSR